MESDLAFVLTGLKIDFEDRCKEVGKYIDFVTLMTEMKYDYLASLDSDDKIRLPYYKIDRDLEKTLRANALLLLYNLVEATMSNCVDSIHSAIEIDSVEFDHLSRNLKSIAISHFKRAVKNSHDSVLDLDDHPIQFAIVNLGYDKEKIFSGNIDCNVIRDTAKKYGFESPDPNKDGRSIARHLTLVRNKRNALAHGRLSFEQCGQDMAPDVLPEIMNETFMYLEEVISAVAKYIQDKGYKLVETA